MILFLILSLIILSFVRSTKILAIVLALLFLIFSGLLFQQNEELSFRIGLGLATLLSLFVALFIGRIPESIDRLRIKKG